MMPARGGPRGGGGAYMQPGPNRGFDSYGRPMPSGEDMYDSQGQAPVGPMRHPSPGPIGMAVSPETVGQAIEMQPQPRRYDTHDSHISNESPHALSVDGQQAPLESPTSLYSRTESYVPARAGWGAPDMRGLSPRPSPSPVHVNGNQGTAYYEDVEPQFARRPSPRPTPQHNVPSALTPGGANCKSTFSPCYVTYGPF